KLALAVAIVAAIAASLQHSGRQLGQMNLTISPMKLAVAIALTLIYRLLNASVWSQVLAGLGQRVAVIPSAALWLKTEAARWLPGSVWNFGTRAVVSKKLSVPATVGALSVVAELMLVIAAWSLIAGCGGVYYREVLSQTLKTIPTRSSLLAFGIGFLTCLAGLTLFRQQLRNAYQKGQAKLRSKLQHLADCSLAWGSLGKAAVAYTVLNLINGVCFWLIVASISPESSLPVEAAIAANATAWLVGFFAIFAPGGLVVREACLATLLSAWLSPATAIAAAILWRVVQIAVEIGALLAAVVLEMALKSGQSASRPA
ncbi:MAG: lysylphosphatidylglycerol synthase domain-containing protein, partial [Lacipirellulaceae bacterium]